MNKNHKGLFKKLVTTLFLFGFSLFAFPASANFLEETQTVIVWGRSYAGLTSLTIWAIAANILLILSSIISYAAFGALAWGAITYILSLGEEGRAAKAKKIILYAVIGLLIANGAPLVAQIVICGIIGNTDSYICAANGGIPAWNEGSITNPIINFINIILIGPAAAIAFGALVAGGYLYMMAAGDEGKISRAKNAIFYALIGLLVIGISGIVVNVVLSI